MENIQFENKYEITKPLIRSWNKVSQKRTGKLRLWFSLIVKMFLVAMAVSTCIAGIVFSVPNLFALTTFYSFGFVFSLISKRITINNKFKQFADLSGQSVWYQTLRFGGKIEMENGNSISSYSFDQISYIEENDECFYLWIGIRAIIILYKNAFTVGDASDFSAYMAEKCHSLWTKREVNRKVFKRWLPFLIVLAVAITLTTLFMWGTVSKAGYASASEIVQQWGDDYKVLTEVDVPNGAVVFYLYDYERVGSLLLKKSGERYYQVTGFTYSIKEIADYNEYSAYLFESDEDDLSFASGAPTVVYGAISKESWDSETTESQKKDYTTVLFSCGMKDYYLYYRFVGAMDKVSD